MMEDGVFLSVVPATTALMTARSTSQSVSLHKGDPLYIRVIWAAILPASLR